MDGVIEAVASWHSLVGALVLFGFAPGFVLRLLVRVYPKDDPRRTELVAELYVRGRVERPFFVAEQLETVLHEGLPHRAAALWCWLVRITDLSDDARAEARQRLARARRVMAIPMIGLTLLLTFGNIVYVVTTISTSAWGNALIGVSGIVSIYLAVRNFRRLRRSSSGIAQSQK